MPSFPRLLSAALAICLAAAAPFAGHGQASDDSDATVLPELVVTARLPGPAWWKVSRGEATVYILGLPMGAWPKDLTWDRQALKRRLGDARLLILPPKFTAGLGDIPALLRLRAEMRTKTPLRARLPPALYDRYLASLMRLNQPSRRYDGWDAMVAGQTLRGDFLRQAGLVENLVQQQALGEARGLRLKRRIQTYKATPELKAIVDQRSAEKGLACFEGDLQDIEAGAARYRAAAAAWARGDVRGAVDLPRGAEVCAGLMADGLIRRTVADLTTGIDEALSEPGVSVALVPVRLLVIRGGVIARLRAQGVTVIDPSALSDDG